MNLTEPKFLCSQLDREKRLWDFLFQMSQDGGVWTFQITATAHGHRDEATRQSPSVVFRVQLAPDYFPTADAAIATFKDTASPLMQAIKNAKLDKWNLPKGGPEEGDGWLLF